MSSHLCPGGCNRRVDATRLLCPYHWRQVSPAHQAELYAAYRARLHRPHDQAAITAHQQAMAAAIGDLAPLPKPPDQLHPAQP